MKNVALGFSTKYDSGSVPAIAVNASGYTLEVHNSQAAAKLWYRLGMLTGCQVSFGPSINYDSGNNPAIALNQQNLAVEVHESDGLSSNMWYHVGIIDTAKNAVNWGGSHKYDSGKLPAVALNDGNVVVEVHESDGPSSNMWYHVGVVDGGSKTIDWGDSHKYDTGSTPMVALNNAGVVVEVHQSNGPSSDLWYHVGVVDSAGKTIDWGASVQYDSGAWPSVTLTDDGFVIEVHQSQAYATTWWRVGTVDVGNKRITWLSDSAQYDRGSRPRVASNGQLATAVAASGYDLRTSSSYIMNRATWMADTLARIGGRTLKQIVMPAAHDASMYTTKDCTGALGFGANACNTQTQTASYAGQLGDGIRYFDVRPVLYGGVMVTGHFNSSPLLGCNGPSMDTVLADVAGFMRGSGELPILKFSHYLNRDDGEGFTDAQMEQLITQVIGKLGALLYTGPTPLAGTPLQQMLAGGGRVIAVFDGLSDALRQRYQGQGIYSYADFVPGSAAQADLTVFDQYANSNDVSTMVGDQLAARGETPRVASRRDFRRGVGAETKLYRAYYEFRRHRPRRKDQARRRVGFHHGLLGKMKDVANHGGDLFLLSWTLTQSETQAIACGAQVGVTSILDLADEANQVLWQNMVANQAAITMATIPNLLYHDAAQGFAADVACWLNQGL